MTARTALSCLALSALVTSALVTTGCEERRNMRTTPDRYGHAYRPDGTVSKPPIAAGQAVPGDDEQVYTVKAGDTMKSVCKQFGITEDKLIERNAITKEYPFKTGLNVIVPKAKPAK